MNTIASLVQAFAGADWLGLLALVLLLFPFLGTTATATNQVALLRRMYDEDVETPFYQASKLYQICRKDTEFRGEDRTVVVDVAPSAGGSADFAEALANQAAPEQVRFAIQHRNEYQVYTIQNSLIARAKGKGAIVDILKDGLDKGRYAFARQMARSIWGNQGGAIGQLASTVTLTTNVLSFRNRSDIAGLEKNMQLTFASDDGSALSPAGTRDNNKKLRVDSVNRPANTAQLSANLNTVAGITVNDFVHRSGDYANKMNGKKAWTPPTDPSPGENFNGIDRTTKDVSRVSGIRFNGNGQNKVMTLIDAAAEGQLAGMGSDPGSKGEFYIAVSPIEYADLQKDRESLREIHVEATETGIGFDALMLNSAIGEAAIFSEVDVPKGFVWMFDEANFWFRTAGECPMLAVNENGSLLISATQDARQGRLACYGNTTDENPGHSVIGTW